MELRTIRERFHNCNGDEEVFKILTQGEGVKPVLVYGCSDYSKAVFDYLTKQGIKVEAFVVDRRYWKKDMYIENVQVQCIEEINIESYNIVIGFGDASKSRFLMENRCILRGEFYFLWEPRKYYEWDLKWVSSNWDNLMTVYNGLADKKSQKVLEELIISKLNVCCSSGLLEEATSGHYFNELTFAVQPEKEVFLDCGAYNGDTIFQYLSFADMKYKKIFAFEPNKENFIKLRQNIKGLSDIEVINKGVWNEETTLVFHDDGQASAVVAEGNEGSVQVTTIDSVVGNEEVTFIKMDIEGSELEALQGAAKTIKKNMPKLAICCYHKKNDIVDLYHCVEQFGNSQERYQIYLRHHSNGACETVLYAIPCLRS